MGKDAGGNQHPADRLRVEAADDARAGLVLRVDGDIDLVTAPLLREEIERRREATDRLVLDLSSIEFLDSTGLVLLMETTRAANAEGWELALRRNVSAPVARLLQVTRTEGLFSWVDDDPS